MNSTNMCATLVVSACEPGLADGDARSSGTAADFSVEVFVGMVPRTTVSACSMVEHA